jgi:hypothetical protein
VVGKKHQRLGRLAALRATTAWATGLLNAGFAPPARRLDHSSSPAGSTAAIPAGIAENIAFSGSV